MEITFEITPQMRHLRGRGHRVAVTKCREDGRHLGAVGVMTEDPERGAVVIISKPVSPETLLAIAHRLVEEAKSWSRPAPTPAAVLQGAGEDSEEESPDP